MNDPLVLSSKDRIDAATRALWASIPVVGPVLSEAVGQLIPAQRIDRVADVLRDLSVTAISIQNDLSNLKTNLRKPEGLDILEEGVTQASRSVSNEKRVALSRILAHSLSEEEIKHTETRTVLELIRPLFPEHLVLLAYCSEHATMNSQFHMDLQEKHPEIFDSPSTTMSASQEEIDREALQKSYRRTLVRAGMLDVENNSDYKITPLGSLVVRYISTAEVDAHGD